MNGQENPAELLVMCVVIILLSILGAAGSFAKGLAGTLDGLLLLFVCLMMILIFGLLLLFQLKRQGLLGKHHDEEAHPGTPATPAK